MKIPEEITEIMARKAEDLTPEDTATLVAYHRATREKFMTDEAKKRERKASDDMALPLSERTF